MSWTPEFDDFVQNDVTPVDSSIPKYIGALKEDILLIPTAHQKITTGQKRYKPHLWYFSAAQVLENAILVFQHSKAFLAKNFSYNIIVCSSAWADPDSRLTALFQRLKEKGITLNHCKYKFNKTRFEVFPFVSSANGICWLQIFYYCSATHSVL